MKFFISIFILLAPIVLLGQQRQSSESGSGGSARGVVKDSLSGYELPAVTITVLKKSDSSLIDYQLTNDQGEFNFKSLPLSVPVIINFSFTGYQTFSKTITLDSSRRRYDFKTVILARSYGTLDEVVVEVPVPIRMVGDTLEINPAAFKLDSNAVVEDMLRRVPGMTIWGDGNITVNGKPINKVYVDGKPFFGGDPAVATQNLPKNAIDKIQVYQEIDYTMDYVDKNPEDSVFTMDIKLKDDKKTGYFGKAGAGLGTDTRYEADATIQAFNKRSRLGLMGITNNINKTGDMQSIIRQSTFRNFNPSNRYVANFGSSGVNKILQGGLNFQHDFSELNNRRMNNQINGSYNFRQNTNNVLTQTQSQQSASGIAFINESDRATSNKNTNHSVNAGYNKRDRNRDFSVNTSFTTGITDAVNQSSQSSSREGAGLVSTSKDASTSHGTNKNLRFSTSYRNRDDDERNLKSFNVSYNLNYSENTSERRTITNFESIADPSKSNYFDRLFDNNSSNFNTSLSFGYNALKRLLLGNFNLWDVNITFNNNLSLGKSSLNNSASDFDTLNHHYTPNAYLTYTNEVDRLEDNPSIRISKNFTKNLSDRYSRYINISANLNGQLLSEKNTSDISYRNLNRDFAFFMPAFTFDYNYRKSRKYEISMNLNQTNSAGIPGIDQLYPIIDSTNQYAITLGNPNLKPYYSNNLDFRFDYRKQRNQEKNELNFGLSFRAGQVQNGITDSSLYHSDGTREIYLINIATGGKNMSAGFNINTSFKLKKNNMLQLSYNTNFSNNTSPNYIDGIYSLAKNDNFTNNLSIFFALGDLATFQVSQGINFNNSLQTGKNLKSFKNTTYNTNASINLNFPKDFSLGNTFNFVDNKSTSQTAALWNAFATYRFLKSKSAEVKFSAMDILRQNQNITVNAGANNLTTTVTNGLQQFYMITLSYYPRQFGQSAGRMRGGGFGGGRGRNF